MLRCSVSGPSRRKRACASASEIVAPLERKVSDVTFSRARLRSSGIRTSL